MYYYYPFICVGWRWWWTFYDHHPHLSFFDSTNILLLKQARVKSATMLSPEKKWGWANEKFFFLLFFFSRVWLKFISCLPITITILHSLRLHFPSSMNLPYHHHHNIITITLLYYQTPTYLQLTWCLPCLCVENSRIKKTRESENNALCSSPAVV